MTVLTKEQSDKCVDHWGGCPECHDLDYVMNVGRVHWMVCREHKKKWCLRSNLFSAWREQTEDDWKKNEEELRDYEEVEPWHPWHDDKRSARGQGEQIRLFWLRDDLGAAACGEDGWAWGASPGEDYARSVSPIVVKAKPSLSKYELACRLRRLASMVEVGEVFPDIEVRSLDTISEA